MMPPSEPAVNKAGVMSTGTGAVSETSNAFEGALEGLDFGGMEPFGLDSVTWLSSDWLNADFQPPGGLQIGQGDGS